MKVNIKRIDTDFLLEATNDTENTLLMDGTQNIGGHHLGFRPMQMLLAAVGGCSAIDVISILKKQKQDISSFEMEVEGDKQPIESYSVYKSIVLHFKIDGQVDPEKAYRAAKLSHDKYCSVSKALEHDSEITFKVSVNGVLVE
ncbi:MAG: OsmC family protein [Bacteroidia bacterium]|nr:OsmC family protein [Bacteroidia bacterium]